MACALNKVIYADKTTIIGVNILGCTHKFTLGGFPFRLALKQKKCDRPTIEIAIIPGF